MISTDKLYFSLSINGSDIPMSEKNIDMFNYTYGVLTTIPTWSLRLLDQYHIGAAVKGAYPIQLAFGAAAMNSISGVYSLHSKLNIESIAVGVPSAGYFDIAGHHAPFDAFLLDNYSKAYEIKKGQDLSLILAKYYIQSDERLRAVSDDLVVYKGVENGIQFIARLAYFCTNNKDTLGFMLFYDPFLKGRMINFVDSIANANFANGKVKNIIITQSKAYALTSTSRANSVRSKIYQEGAFQKFCFLNDQLSPQTFINTDVLTKISTIEGEISDVLTQNYSPYNINNLGKLSKLEKEFFTAYTGNFDFWQYVKRYTVEVSVMGFLSEIDTEPGSLVKLFDALNAPNGIYVILQKSYFVTQHSGLYTKLYLLFVKEDTR